MSKGKLQQTVHEEMVKQGVGWGGLAEQLSVNVRSLRRWNLGVKNATIEEKAQAWLTKNWHDGTSAARRFIDLRNGTDIIETCSYAVRRGTIVAIVGSPGTGKTMGVNEGAKAVIANGNPVLSITPNPRTTGSSIAKMLLERLSYSTRGTSWDQLERAVRVIKSHRPPLLIIDEANRLPRDAMECLRHLHDHADIPMVLAGSRALLRTLLQPDKNQESDHLRTRITRVVLLNKLTIEETRRCVEFRLGQTSEPVIAAFHKGSKGIARNLFNALDDVDERLDVVGRHLPTPEMVERAYKCLLIGIVDGGK